MQVAHYDGDAAPTRLHEHTVRAVAKEMIPARDWNTVLIPFNLHCQNAYLVCVPWDASAATAGRTLQVKRLMHAWRISA